MADDAEVQASIESLLRMLSPESRSRVLDSLASSVEASESPLASALRQTSFSRGVFFSRSSSPALAEANLIFPEISKMDEEKFQVFAQRLSQLKDQRGSRS